MSSKHMKSHLFLLKLIENSPDNKHCADCGTEGTRWASWNLGVFLCIRCAGIHRKLGVHISKVKSVDLDSWTQEQLQSMEQQGNRKSHLLYEARLPKDYIRPTNNYQIEELIRAKYEHKKYFMSPSTSKQSEALNKNDLPKKLPDQIIDIESNNFENSSVSSPANNQSKNKQPFKKTHKELKSDLLCDLGESSATNQFSDDSLSDPEYLQVKSSISKKKSKKPTVNTIDNLSSARSDYHKVHSDGDLINLNSNGISTNHMTMNASGNNKQNISNKDAIMSLYNSSGSTMNSYNQQYNFQPNNQTSYHRSYGSATYSSDSFTNSIPSSTQGSYMKMFQDKLGSFKDQIQNRFSTYEQPRNASFSAGYNQSPVANRNYQHHTPNSSNTNNNTTGHTLAPDLWK